MRAAQGEHKGLGAFTEDVQEVEQKAFARVHRALEEEELSTAEDFMYAALIMATSGTTEDLELSKELALTATS